MLACDDNKIAQWRENPLSYMVNSASTERLHHVTGRRLDEMGGRSQKPCQRKRFAVARLAAFDDAP